MVSETLTHRSTTKTGPSTVAENPQHHKCCDTKQRRPRLTLYHEANAFNVEPFILSHYRTDYCYKSCIKSLFQLHNETWNVWTHLLGSLFFLWLLWYSSSLMPEIKTVYTLQGNSTKLFIDQESCLHSSFVKSNGLLDTFTTTLFGPFCHSVHHILQNNLQKDSVFTSSSLWSNERSWIAEELSEEESIALLEHKVESVVHEVFLPTLPKWPIYLYCLTASYTMLASAFLHLFGCTNEVLHGILAKVDHSGISVSLAGSFVGAVYFQAPLGDWRFTYITMSVFCAVGTATFTIIPYFAKKSFRIVRTVMFVVGGLFGVFPFGHQAILFGLFHPVYVVSLVYVFMMAAMYIGGAVIYATRVPERFAPGKFDVWFSSHQIWHVFVFSAALCLYYAIIGMYITAHFGW